ncbi:MAG: hypothetical protein IRY91_06780, partial [Gemmatimonadaceae bacterium]|nr:hypothetical protein [Gemmatimonadaceae bacterium]
MIIWALAGVAVGALVASVVARFRIVVLRREHLLHLRRRDGSIDRLKGAVKEHAVRLKRQAEHLRELDTLRKDRMALAAQLEAARRTITELQSTVDSVRAAAREAELRLNAALDSERQENAARRAASAAELAAAQESALNLRAELASARETTSRTVARLEADLASVRSLLERTSEELRSERAAAAEMRTELNRRISALEDERLRLESELSAERHANAEKQSSLRSFVSTLREQYALACAERDAAVREVELHRGRAEELARRLEEARTEFGRRLDSEHEESVELISRVWDYVHNYPRLRERPIHGPPEPPRTGAHRGAREGASTPPADVEVANGGTPI